MALREEFETAGNWLFKWRSYLPVLFIGVILAGIYDSDFTRAGVLPRACWEGLCLGVSFFGLAVRAYTVGQVPKGTSGRNTSKQIAHVLNTSGIYSVVRNPLYLGNFFCFLGIAMYPRQWWVALLYVLLFWLYYERIVFAEEEFLRRKFGRDFEDWAARTPAFVPRLRNWKRSELRFSLRNVLKREYSGLFSTALAFTFVGILGELRLSGRLVCDPRWLVLFSVSLVMYLALRILRKTTRLLDVEGR